MPLTIKTGYLNAKDDNGHYIQNNTVAEPIPEAVAAWLDDHPEATTTVQDGSITAAKLNDNLKVIDYNILDYAGNSLNEKWDNMRADFVAWQYKHVIIPYPREECSACIQVDNDWRWKINGAILFDDSCNNMDIEVCGELYAVSAVSQVLLFDDAEKPENIYFINGIQIRGNRFSGHTIDCAIEVRAGARINFCGQTIINDCGTGIIIGGANQSAPSEAYFDRVQVAFFDENTIYVHGGQYTAAIFAEHIETATAQNADLDSVLISGKVPNSKIGYLTYGTDIAKQGYAAYDANSVLKCLDDGGEVHNVIVGFLYATASTYVAYLDGSGSGNVFDVHLGTVGGSTSATIAIYGRNCSGLTVDNIKRDNLVDIENCFYSRLGKQTINTSDSFDRFAGIDAVVNIDGITSINSVPAVSNKEIGAVTIVKNANGKRVYLNDGDENIQIDGQMFVPSVTSLPSPSWIYRGKMYRINNDSGTDVIAICIRYGGTGYRWFDLIANTVI